MNGTPIQPADRVKNLKPYSPPARNASVRLRLDNNEGAPVNQSVLDSIKDINTESLSRYPDAGALERSIAQRFGIDRSRVIVTNGGDDAIDRSCRALLSPHDQMLTHSPGFVMIPRYAQLAGAQVITVNWIEDDFPKGQFIDSIKLRTKLITLVSPNNPTGAVIATNTIMEIAHRAESNGVVVLLDQAYIEFADEDPIDQLIDLPNVVIVRTFSKAMGLAGLRVGYAIGPQKIIEWLRTAGGPYPVSAFSLAIAQAALDQFDERESSTSKAVSLRKQLIQLLNARRIQVLPSQANFVLAKFDNASETYESLLKQGVSVRRFDQSSGIPSYLRITVPANLEQLNQLIGAINTIGATA